MTDEYIDGLLATSNVQGEPLIVTSTSETGVRTVTLNRPESRNAWNEAMEVQFTAALNVAADDVAVRVVVITGAGPSFCPGMDSSRLEKVTKGGEAYGLQDRDPFILRRISKPVIAVVNGACAGVGFVQAMMADVRITSSSARWSSAFTRIGLVAEDGLSWRLQRIAGEAVASDLLLSSRVFDGDEAARMGIATMSVNPGELNEVALEYAEQLASCSPIAMALTKLQLNRDAAADLDGALVRARTLLALAKTQSDYPEGVEALLAKRRPRFAPLPEGWSYTDPERPEEGAA